MGVNGFISPGHAWISEVPVSYWVLTAVVGLIDFARFTTFEQVKEGPGLPTDEVLGAGVQLQLHPGAMRWWMRLPQLCWWQE